MAMTLAFLGDVMLGRGVSDEFSRRSPRSFWGTTLPILRAADAVIANLECAITTHQQRWWKTPKVFYFGADPRAIAVLQAAKVRCASLANNHILDYDDKGLFDTLKFLDQAHIAHAGAGHDLAEAMRPALLDAGDLKLAVISATDNEPPFAAGPNRAGTFHLPIRPSSLTPIGQAIDQARAAGARFVILALHWGPNMVTSPPEAFQQFAHATLDLGADLIFGHSAHLFQGVQRVGRKPILYDTGDFLDDYAVDPDLRNDWSFIFLLDLEENRPARLRMIPVRLRYAQVDLATGGEFDAIIQRMTGLCADLGTSVEKDATGLQIVLDAR